MNHSRAWAYFPQKRGCFPQQSGWGPKGASADRQVADRGENGKQSADGSGIAQRDGGLHQGQQIGEGEGVVVIWAEPVIPHAVLELSPAGVVVDQSRKRGTPCVRVISMPAQLRSVVEPGKGLPRAAKVDEAQHEALTDAVFGSLSTGQTVPAD